MKKVWRLVEAKYPKIMALPCWMHIMNLAMLDVVSSNKEMKGVSL